MFSHDYFPDDYFHDDYWPDGITDSTTLEILIAKRNASQIGGTRTTLLQGIESIVVTAFEPDAVTFRGEYYYNAVSNLLFRKIIRHNTNGLRLAFWQQISE